MDNAEKIAQQLAAIQHELAEMRDDIRVLLEASRELLEEIETVQSIREAT